MTKLLIHSGKSRYAHLLGRTMAGGFWVYPGTDAAHPWFDGYASQSLVIFDDFRGATTFRFAYLLRLLDRYPMRVPVKGGFVEWNPKKIIITSNHHPSWWGYSDRLDPLLRRIRRIDRIDYNLFE